MDPPQTQPAPSVERLVLFFSGDTLGSLKPCGCSGGQLGGLEKRPAIFSEVPASERLLLDTGSLVEGDREQDLIKFRILFRAFSLLGYDAIGLTQRDVEIAESLGLIAGQQHPFAIIGSDGEQTGVERPASFSRSFRLNGGELAVNVAAFDARSDTAERAAELFASAPRDWRLNVLILHNSDPGSVLPWTQASGADCIVCTSTTDEPQQLSEHGARPLVFTVGRFGRHLCRVRVALSAAGTPTLEWTDISVTEDLPDEPALAQLYRQYQQIVSDSNLLENYPRVPLPDGLRYAGSKSCQPCHLYEYTLWGSKAHASAFATLVEVGSDRDPECVICHVVGMDRESGFISAQRTPGLKDVGCEVCHGPGSQHNASQGLALTVEPKVACLDCHTPEKSSGYAGHEEEYLEKITHWWEP
ncbi:MAG: hypothetical protein JW993_06225 [Sedimentisphaerales bacterium]|nr:hypothetical protein [Sedimentisphaerales bacterium]